MLFGVATVIVGGMLGALDNVDRHLIAQARPIHQTPWQPREGKQGGQRIGAGPGRVGADTRSVDAFNPTLRAGGDACSPILPDLVPLRGLCYSGRIPHALSVPRLAHRQAAVYGSPSPHGG